MAIPDSIESNVTGLSYAKESSFGVLPGTANWQAICPNTYSDFGGEIKNVARDCIEPSRQVKKGTVVDLDASGGFNIDFTQNNLTDLLQGFLFANAREKAKSQPLNGTQVTLTAVVGGAGTSSYDAASGLDVFKAGDLVLGVDFADPTNNGLKNVTTVVGTSVDVAETLVAQASPAATARLINVGFKFAAGDLDITASSSTITLSTSVQDLSALGLTVGEWIFLGGDVTLNQYDNNDPGYARIVSIDTNAIVIEEPTWTPVTEAGGTKEIYMFFGTVIRNEKEQALIIKSSYNLERQLGNDGDGIQSEYLEGAVPNEFSLNIPTADKLHADLSFVAKDNVQRTGIEGIKVGNRLADKNEDAYNTTSDIYRSKLSLHDPLLASDTNLINYVMESTITINNNVSPNKALGLLGSFSTTAGNFMVGGSITAYFATVEAVKAVRNNSDVGFSIISASQNAGLVFDTPLISLGNGRLQVEKDSPIKIPLDQTGAENDNGYTLMYVNFEYLPDIAMPQ